MPFDGIASYLRFGAWGFTSGSAPVCPLGLAEGPDGCHAIMQLGAFEDAFHDVEAALLDAAKRAVLDGVTGNFVEVHRAGLEAFDAGQCGVDSGGYQAQEQAEVRGVGDLDDIIEVLDGKNGDQGSGGLQTTTASRGTSATMVGSRSAAKP